MPDKVATVVFSLKRAHGVSTITLHTDTGLIETVGAVFPGELRAVTETFDRFRQLGFAPEQPGNSKGNA